MLVAALATLLASCATAPEDCVSIREDATFANHVMPFGVAVDPVHRRAWSTALATPTLAGFDLDSGEQVAAISYLDTSGEYPSVAVDAVGNAWIGLQSDPGLVRVDTATAEATMIDGFTDVHAVLALPDGGVAVIGSRSGEPSLWRLDGDGEVMARADAGGGAGLLLAGDRVGVVGSAQTISLRDASTMDERDACPLSFAPTHGAAVPGGYVIATSTRIGFTDCAGTTWELAVGNENRDVIAQDDGAWVLDRIGAPDPNLGLARFVTANGIGPSFPTAKNTGFGGWDPATGLLWGNSEGTAEVVAWNPVDGTARHTVRTGDFVDGLAHQPDRDDVWATGRLSDTVVRLAGGRVAARTREVHWPFSPTLDRDGDRLWLLSQTEAEVFALDAETLAVKAAIDLGAGPNPLLTFGTLTFEPRTERVYVAESHTDEVVGIDLAGAVVGRWPLGGPPVTDPDAIGELRVRQDGPSGALVITRTTDGRVQRLDPATGELTTVWLPDAELAHLRASRQVDAMRILAGPEELWLGGFAFAARTLDRLGDHDLAAAAVLARYPGRSSGRITLAPDADAFEHLDADGDVTGHLVLASPLPNASVVRMRRGGATAVVGRAAEALVCTVDLSALP